MHATSSIILTHVLSSSDTSHPTDSTSKRAHPSGYSLETPPTMFTQLMNAHASFALPKRLDARPLPWGYIYEQDG